VSPHKKRAMVSMLLLGVLVYGSGAIRLRAGGVLSVDVDLGKPESIVWPFELSIVGDTGETGVRIPPKAGTGWNGKAGGEAIYRFHVPEDGTYHLWANCRWFDKCTNAVYATVDRMDKVVVGNDPIYQQWHWVRGFPVRLRRGPHALKLANHSDHVALLKVRLINSGVVLPEECGIVFSDVFYDGFDGCHIGNFASWKPLTGEWEVQRPDPLTRYMDNALLGTSKGEATIVYPAEDWSNYSLHVAVRSMGSAEPNGVAGVLFGVRGAEYFHQLLWTAAGEGDQVTMELIRREGTVSKALAIFQVPWSGGKWHQIEITSNERKISVGVDNEPQAEIVVDEDVMGGIGLYLQGRCSAWFDEVHVRTKSAGTAASSESRSL
jgi:hypothetical protein